MGAGASVQLTKEEEVMLYEKLQEVYDKEKGDKKVLNEEEEHEMFLLLQKSYKKMVIDLKRDEYLAKSGVGGAPSSESKQPEKSLPDIFLSVFKPKESVVHKAVNKFIGLAMNGAGGAHEEFCVGDIIRGKPEGDFMFYEGVIQSMNEDKSVFQVDFDGEIEKVRRENAQRVLAWNTVEVGDIVQAQPADERNFYNAIVVRVNANGTYRVIYEGDDEEEDGVPEGRVRKICSNRAASHQKWKKGFNTIQASHAFTSLFGKKYSLGGSRASFVSQAGGEGSGGSNGGHEAAEEKGGGEDKESAGDKK
mmetsp:Transcript_35449/g.55692  ORF Transcript_35449/g.55692 Transcript_35449/m.55692 type:complete len:306 (-) Transcript_35449:257-1174(-)